VDFPPVSPFYRIRDPRTDKSSLGIFLNARGISNLGKVVLPHRDVTVKSAEI
jgi:hypothetical protein